MKIYVYTSVNKELEQAFNEYSNAVNSVFDCTDDKFDVLMKKAIFLKDEVQVKLSNLTPAKSFEEDFFDQQIEDEETKALLSNGLYSKAQLIELLAKCPDTLASELNFTDADKILFWNC